MSSISKAIHRAYKMKEERGWNIIYWCIDLHGVCLKSNYKQGGYQWINDSARKGMKAIDSQPDSVIILWSSVHDEEKADIVKFFNDQGIIIHCFNGNPFEGDTKVSNFSEKFYFSILLDDKAGFDPEVDWSIIETYLKGLKQMENIEKKKASKPVVQFIKGTNEGIAVGMRGWCETVDHPNLGATDVHTSRVEKINEDGSFETLNTIYKPVEQLNG